MNQKEMSIFVESFANAYGFPKSQVMDWILEAFSAYVSKNESNGNGSYFTKFEDNKFVTYRRWTLVEDDIVMEDPDLQWRVLDAVDEGFEDAEPGDEITVEVEPVVLTRKCKQWIEQFILRKIRDISPKKA